MELETRWLWLWGLLAGLTGAWLLAGCSAAAARPDPELLARERRCNEAIIRTTEAINAGELARARQELDVAADCSVTFDQARRVRSLDRLIAGAAALMDGQPELARVQWSQIEDPRLHREVREQARRINLDVPLVPVTEDQP